MAEFIFSRAVTFADCDPGGMAHFSRLACFVEEAEHAFLRDAGFPIDPEPSDALFWPRVSFSAEYHSPLRFGETAEVQLIPRAGTTSITWDWSIRTAERTVATGTLKTVCCRKKQNSLVPQPLPDALAVALTSCT